MRNLIILAIFLIGVLGTTSVQARGAGADDCPPGSTDPDCVGSAKTPPAGSGK